MKKTILFLSLFSITISALTLAAQDDDLQFDLEFDDQQVQQSPPVLQTEPSNPQKALSIQKQPEARPVSEEIIESCAKSLSDQLRPEDHLSPAIASVLGHVSLKDDPFYRPRSSSYVSPFRITGNGTIKPFS